ncbi:AMP-binding protein [Salinisphaera aquimarina]|uniref:AMP-binding protein n=1 Tax=Salinisphaera aquimarina TaxID=2094031 RepID=A0ABV7ELT5_9GAMM
MTNLKQFPTLSQALAHHAATRPDAPALSFHPANDEAGSDWMTFGEANAQVSAIAAALRQHGVASGDRVAVRLGKSAVGLLLFLGVLRAGAIYVPVNPKFTSRETGILLEDATPSLLIDNKSAELDDAVREKVRVLGFRNGESDDLMNSGRATGAVAEEPGSNDYAAMLFTSGTTGRPKGAPLTHGNLMSNIGALGAVWGISPGDRVLHVLPVFHAHGLFIAAALPLAHGASVIVTENFDAAQTIRLLPEATVFMAVPAIYTRLVQREDFNQAACRHLRLATSGSAPLSPELFQTLRDRMGIYVVERYGLTETSILTTNPIDGSARVGSVGKPLPTVELRIADETGAALPPGEVGQLHARTPSTIRGYWNRPELGDEWSEDGFFDTGDMGRIDEDGFVWLVGRKKELIISGGYNVYPREVENVLETVPGVDEAAVLGVPHPDFGEGVVAAIKCDPAHPVSREEIDKLTARDLTSYKRPKAVVFLEEFPRNAMGKVMKNELRQIYATIFSDNDASS